MSKARQNATVQQKKLISLLLDLTGTTREQLARENGWTTKGIRPSRNHASKMIAALVKLAEERGVPTYKYKPAPVRKSRMKPNS